MLKRNKVCRGPMCGSYQTLKQKQKSQRQTSNIIQKRRSVESKSKFDEAQKRILKTTKKFKDTGKCFITPEGDKVCGKNKNLFVSPKQYLENVDEFIQEDLPSALFVGLTAAGLGLGGALPLIVAAPLTGLSKGIKAERRGFGTSQVEDKPNKYEKKIFSIFKKKKRRI